MVVATHDLMGKAKEGNAIEKKQASAFVSRQTCLLAWNGDNITAQSAHNDKDIVESVPFFVLAWIKLKEVHTQTREYVVRDRAIVQRSLTNLVFLFDTLTDLALACNLFTETAQFLVRDAKMIGSAKDQETLHKASMVNIMHSLNDLEVQCHRYTRFMLECETSSKTGVMWNGIAILKL